MEIKLITNECDWDEFIRRQPYTLFVQSPEYRRFYESQGEKGWIWGIYEQEKLIGGSLVLTTHARRGNFLYLPYGPILNWSDPVMVQTFFNHLKNFAQKEHLDFIRTSPFTPANPKGEASLRAAGLRPSPLHSLAEHTWILSLKDLSEEQLLAQMKKGHRYEIRRCEKEGVVIEKTTDPSRLAMFNQLHDQTAQRHNFHRFSPHYIETEFKNHDSLLILGYLPDGRLDSAAIIIFYGSMAAYRHGASLNLNNKLPSSYLVQWSAIKEAKNRNCRHYNFWGIAPDNASPHHPFFGLTHFKTGFGGQGINLQPSFDLPITKKYYLTRFFEYWRKWKRGF